MNLKDKAISGVKWTTINSVTKTVLSPIVLTILARILSPEEYGLIAIITIITGFSKQIAHMGFSQAIIQRDEINKGDLSSVFWFEQVLGVLAFIIVFTLSDYIVLFFDAPDAAILVQVSAFVFLLEPIDLVFRALLKKEMKFETLVKANLIRTVFTQVSKVLLVIVGFGVMGVVLGQLIGIAVLTVILFYIFYTEKIWLPKLYFSFKQLKPYLSFGIFIAGKSIFNNLFNYIDEIIIGGSLGTEVLGLYHFAKQILNFLIGLFNKPISEVGFPLLSKIKNDIAKFNFTYKKLIKFIGTISIPAYTGIAVTAPLFVPIFFGAEWNDAINVIIILSGWGMFKSMYSGIISSAFYSFGQSSWILYATMIDLPIRAIILYFMSQLGIEYVALGLTLIAIGKFIIYQNILKMLSKIKVISIFLSLKYIFLATILMAITLQIPLIAIIARNIYVELVITILTGVLVYGLVMFVFERKYLIETYNMAKIW